MKAKILTYATICPLSLGEARVRQISAESERAKSGGK